MSYTSNYNLNQRVSYLESEINKIAPIPPGGYTLANVLNIGNSAGATDIDMNNQDILQVNNIDLSTINGGAYPPVVPAPDLDAVLTVGNSAGANDINLNFNDITNANQVDFALGAATASLLFDPLAPANFEISCSGDLELRPTGSIDCNGATIDLTNGRIIKCDDIESPNNVDLNIICNGTADLVIETGGTERFRINDSGVATFSTALPECSIVPTTGDQLVNKTYADSLGGGIPTYTDDTARNTAIPSPVVGDFCYLSDTSELQVYNFSVWITLAQVLPQTFTITGFTLGVDYSVTYFDAGGSVVPNPVQTGSTLVVFNPTTTTSGTFTPDGAISSVYYLVLAGGGGGGGSQIGVGNSGGGGAGGLLSNYPSGSTVGFLASTSYNISVGGGGAGGVAPSLVGTVGGNSVLNYNGGTLTAFGGGRGGSGAGGSGGGGASTTSGQGAGGTGVVGQGNNGGAGIAANFSGGGGGGASAVGVFNGGDGVSNSITGSAVTYAGGGGGGTNGGTQALGGAGGGGNGGYSASQLGQPGTDGLGGGGGAGGFPTSSPGFNGGAGGSGLLVLRFPSFIKY